MSDDRRREAIGPVLDALDIRMTNLAPGHLVADAVVILRIVTDDGASMVRHVWSSGMDWVTRRGIIETVRDVERTMPDEAQDES